MLLQILKDRAASSDNAGNAVPNDQVLAEDSQAYFLGKQRPDFDHFPLKKSPQTKLTTKKSHPKVAKRFRLPKRSKI